MSTSTKRSPRLLDAHRLPRFRPRETVTGVRGDPAVAIVRRGYPSRGVVVGSSHRTIRQIGDLSCSATRMWLVLVLEGAGSTAKRAAKCRLSGSAGGPKVRSTRSVRPAHRSPLPASLHAGRHQGIRARLAYGQVARQPTQAPAGCREPLPSLPRMGALLTHVRPGEQRMIRLREIMPLGH